MAYDQRTADVEQELEQVKACLRDLMDAAHRDRTGSPLPYDEWRIRYDEARRITASSTSPRMRERSCPQCGRTLDGAGPCPTPGCLTYPDASQERNATDGR